MPHSEQHRRLHAGGRLGRHAGERRLPRRDAGDHAAAVPAREGRMSARRKRRGLRAISRSRRRRALRSFPRCRATSLKRFSSQGCSVSSRACMQSSAYYRARMDAAPASIRTRSTSLADFCAAFPTSTKADFLADQNEHPPFGERLGIPREEVALVNMTGGTSGQGQEIYGRSQRDVHMQGYLHALPWFLAGLRPGDIAFNCVPAGGLTTGGWGPGEGLRIIGATAFHVGGTLSTDAKIDLMLRVGDVNFIYASTNYLHTLTDALLRRGLEPKRRLSGHAHAVHRGRGLSARMGANDRRALGLPRCRKAMAARSARASAPRRSTRRVRPRRRARADAPVRMGNTVRGARSGNHAAGRSPARRANWSSPTCRSRARPVVRFRTGDSVRFVARRGTRSGRAVARHRVRHDRPLRRHDEDPRQQRLAVGGRRGGLRASRGRRIYRPRLHRRGRQDRVRGACRADRAGRAPRCRRIARSFSARCGTRSRSAPMSG